MNIATKSDAFVLTEEERMELQRINRERILSTPLDTPETPSAHSALPHNQPLTSDHWPSPSGS
jgi:hypothetical protein